jgi:chorismate-pyruvate lyase
MRPHARGVSRWLAASMLGLLGARACYAGAPDPAAAGTPGHLPLWSDSIAARLEALALLQTLNADLLSHDSATLTLDRWCEAHQMASPARVVADRLAVREQAPSALQRHELEVTATEPVRYRRVELRCGDHVLSEAENWYVPDRLTPEMNRVLDTTDTSFGRVVRALHFSRHVLEATLLWSPLPAGWDSDTAHRLLSWPAWPGARSPVLRHRAVLVLPDGRPISEVVETYTAAVLDFPQPQLQR